MPRPVELPPGILIAAPRSGAGKTTVTLGLLRALSRRGTSVQPFKCGPDYIDPAFHEAACHRTSFNIDSWAMREEIASNILAAGAASADFIVAEALMGLFDGVATRGAWGNGASADLAAVTGWPVVLVLDISGQSQTAAAVARGFRDFRTGVEIAGVILNRVGSDRHQRLAKLGFEQAGIKVFGAIPRKREIAMPERHLGLVQASEMAGLDTMLNDMADFVEAHVDVAALRAAARAGRCRAISDAVLKPPGQRIALAHDDAFSFIYPHVLTQWRSAGAEIVPFSPLNDEAPEMSCDVVWLPGGYPELYAGRLASNHSFLTGTRAYAQAMPVHGECGGYMVLGQAVEDADGHAHQMLGLLGVETTFAKRRMQLGYRRARLLSDCPVGKRGTEVSGHEFHYATVIAAPDEKLCAVTDADGAPVAEGGSRRGNVTGTFFHLVDQTS